jgi:hypothetical protein
VDAFTGHATRGWGCPALSLLIGWLGNFQNAADVTLVLSDMTNSTPAPLISQDWANPTVPHMMDTATPPPIDRLYESLLDMPQLMKQATVTESSIDDLMVPMYAAAATTRQPGSMSAHELILRPCQNKPQSTYQVWQHSMANDRQHNPQHGRTPTRSAQVSCNTASATASCHQGTMRSKPYLKPQFGSSCSRQRHAQCRASLNAKPTVFVHAFLGASRQGVQALHTCS